MLNVAGGELIEWLTGSVPRFWLRPMTITIRRRLRHRDEFSGNLVKCGVDEKVEYIKLFEGDVFHGTINIH